MPRFSRESIKTTYFHVMTQGINKSYIFERPEEIKFYIKIMYELLAEHNLKIIAYCIMNNHAHMLVKTKDINELSKYMQRLNSKYAVYYNKIHNRVGYVFRDRFKSEGIYSQKQFYNCIKYIYDNPVKAGICSGPELYPYSNYKKIPIEMIDNTYTFIDTDEEKTREYMEEIENFISIRNIKIIELINDKKSAKELAKILMEKHGLSLRKIAELLGIGRETLRKICS